MPAQPRYFRSTTAVWVCGTPGATQGHDQLGRPRHPPLHRGRHCRSAERTDAASVGRSRRGHPLRRITPTSEIVQEIITGYRDGHPAFAREGEPRSPFGPGFGVSEHKRCIAMAKQLNLEAKFDRDLQRRLAEGDLKSGGVSEQTIRRWVREFKWDGLLHWTCQGCSGGPKEGCLA